MMWPKIAFRNLLRNRRRSLITIAAVALGFAAVNVFGGFTDYMFVNLRDSFIHAGGNGHFQIFKKGYAERGSIEPEKYFLSEEEFRIIQEVADADARVHLVAGRMQLTGTIDYDGTSTIFIGDAMMPSKVETMYQRAENLNTDKKRYEGEALSDDEPQGIAVSGSLAEVLKLEPGALVLLAAPTLEGNANALDAEIRQVAQSISQGAAARLVRIPLEWAQELVQTGGVAQVCVLLEDRGDLDETHGDLMSVLGDRGLELESRTWDELSTMYRLTKNMFDIIFGVVFAILIIIVSMSVMNTIGMAVMERTSEIGTLRSMGLKRRGVVKLFSLESAFLGLLGSAVGLVITVGVWWIVQLLKPMWVPPMVGFKVRLQIMLVPEYLLVTFVFLALLTMAAAILPARRAAHASIVDSLGHS
ncbi:MAG: FtsX-like permease family protein [Verrucomicrobiota bacterium]